MYLIMRNAGTLFSTLSQTLTLLLGETRVGPTRGYLSFISLIWFFLFLPLFYFIQLLGMLILKTIEKQHSAQYI